MCYNRGCMILVHLSLTNFRNFVRLELDLPPGPILLVGANAQGKTSLLEAVHYLSGARAAHAPFDRQLINFLALLEPLPFARLEADVKDGGINTHLDIRLIASPKDAPTEARTRKEVLINGVKRHSPDLAQAMKTVLFLPRDMHVIEGPPSERRHHLDTVLCQADAAYAQTLAEYGKVLSQRNALLKQLHDRGSDGDQLAFWDERLTDLASTLIRSRALALEELQRIAARIHLDLTRGAETLRLHYQPSYDPVTLSHGQLGLDLEAQVDWTHLTRHAIRNGMRASLQRMRAEEIARGMTLTGPHRDDYVPYANGLDLRLYGSRGQNRTTMLTLKLSEVDWLQERTGKWPVLLLDEVLAELDPEHRGSLLARVHSVHQAILTAADLAMFSGDFQRQATLWRVSSGTVAAA